MLGGKSAGLAASLLAGAITVTGLWWSAFTTDRLLHDDVAFTAQITAALDQPAVRSEVASWLRTGIASAGRASGHSLDDSPILDQLTGLLTSKQKVAPLADALVAAVVEARDQAVAQLDGHANPKTTVAIDLSGVLKAAKIKVDKNTAALLGVKLDKGRLAVPLMLAESLDRYQFRYDIGRLTAQWGAWLAAVLAIGAVVTSPRPLRLVAIGAGALALVAAAAGPLMTLLGTLLAGDAIGGLLQPVISTATTAASPVTWFVAGVAGGAAVGCFIVDFLLNRRATPGTPDLGAQDQPAAEIVADPTTRSPS